MANVIDVFRGPTRAAIDWSAPVATVPDSAGQASVPHAAGATWWYAARRRDDATGRHDGNTDAVAEAIANPDGSDGSARPRPVPAIRCRPCAGGTAVEWAYPYRTRAPASFAATATWPGLASPLAATVPARRGAGAMAAAGLAVLAIPPGTAAEVAVVAVNAAGDSEPCAVRYTPPAASPAGVGNLSVS